MGSPIIGFGSIASPKLQVQVPAFQKWGWGLSERGEPLVSREGIEGFGPGLSAPSLGWPVLLECPLNPARQATSKSGALRQRAATQAWTPGLEPRVARPAPPGSFAAAENRGPLPALAAVLASKEPATHCPPPQAPKDGKAACLLRARGAWDSDRGWASANHRNDSALGELGGIPGLGHPLVLFSFLNQGLSLLLGPWEFGDSLPLAPAAASCYSSPQPSPGRLDTPTSPLHPFFSGSRSSGLC